MSEAVQRAKKFLTKHKMSLSTFAWCVGEWYYYWSGDFQPLFRRSTIKRAVKELHLVTVPGYKAAHCLPVGSYLFVFPENLKAYGIIAQEGGDHEKA